MVNRDCGSLGPRSEDVQKNLKKTRWKRVGWGDGGGGGDHLAGDRDKQQAVVNTAGNEFSE